MKKAILIFMLYSSCTLSVENTDSRQLVKPSLKNGMISFSIGFVSSFSGKSLTNYYFPNRDTITNDVKVATVMLWAGYTSKDYITKTYSLGAVSGLYAQGVLKNYLKYLS